MGTAPGGPRCAAVALDLAAVAQQLSDAGQRREATAGLDGRSTDGAGDGRQRTPYSQKY